MVEFRNIKKIGRFGLVALLLLVSNYAYTQTWTEDSAREEAFRNIELTLDISQYAAIDPNLKSNRETIAKGRDRIDNRFLTADPPPSTGYTVSELDKNGLPKVSMRYDKDGNLLDIRLLSKPRFPRIAYFYNGAKSYFEKGKEIKPGELVAVNFEVSLNNRFLFFPDGKLAGHFKL
tara:strand:+ start:939 stop:1466 length:528 start_codon:yes stop_codon:yes gene_type:complete